MKISSQQRGFGLLEVMVASGILAMVVGALVGLVRSSLRRTTIGLERSVAMNLAQEPIEQLRSLRDSIFVDQKLNTWLNSWPVESRIDCEVLITDPNPICSVFRVTKNSNGGWLVGNGNEQIPLSGQTYTREVYISTPRTYVSDAGIVGLNSGDNVELVRKVHVIVRWNSGSVESATYLTNWRTGL